MSAQNNQVVSFLRGQVKGANEFLEAMTAEVTSEQAHWAPTGVANPIGATYAHVVTSQDVLINGMLRGTAPLFASTWAGKIGVSEAPPSPGMDEPGFPDWSEWARKVKIDLSAIREYAQAVYESVDDYLASLRDEDLNQKHDLSSLGLGEMTTSQLINVALLANTQWHTGEIACLKGLQGQKGYPF